jgi:adenylate cyclase class 2
MKIEYEATFQDIEKDAFRNQLKDSGAKLVRPEFMQKRMVFDLPPGKETKGGFVRVRDEGDKVTLTLKIVDGNKISDQKETMVTVDDFDSTGSLMSGIGCIPRSHEESKRELWSLDGADITIDEWPFLGTIAEVEGVSEEIVKTVSEKLGFEWKAAKFCSIGTLYVEKYGFGPMDISKKTGKVTELTFEGENPFITT